MKLFYVSARYTPKGCKNARGYSGYTIAENEKEALEKLKASLPEGFEDRPTTERYGFRYNVWECESGISLDAIRR